VDHVHDGDSVRLADGRALRLIGIDTPELARDGRPDEPLARAARDRLRELLRDSGMRLELRFDREREDHYGRLLAHAYLPDGRSIAAELLAEGLATQLVVPPNEASWTCFRQAERVARRARLGLWALPGYQVGLEGELVEARGRLRGYHDELQVTVHHPFALAVIEAP
jgi:endonuclease YncB( thermonuclease family)